MSTNIGVRPSHKIGVQYNLPHGCRNNHGLEPIAATDLIGNNSGHVFFYIEAHIRRQSKDCGGEFGATLQTLGLR